MEETLARITAVEAALNDVRQRLDGLANLRGEFTDHVNRLNGEKEVFMDQVQKGFASASTGQDNITSEAQKKFRELEESARLKFEQIEESAKLKFQQGDANMVELHGRMEAAIRNMNTRINSMGGPNDSEGNKSQKGFIPKKSLAPKPFSDKLEEWRQWQEEIEDYFDTMNPGMRGLLKDINKQKNASDLDDDVWIPEMVSQFGSRVAEDRVQVWRAFKKLTEGEVRKVVTSVKDENGFMAWFQLRMRFEPCLAAKTGIILAEFSGMVSRPAKTPVDLVALITEMDKKLKIIEDIMDNKEHISETHKKSVLVGILDPATRQQTAMIQDQPYETLRLAILQCANNMVAVIHPNAPPKDNGGPAPMAIGGFGLPQREEKGDQEQGGDDEWLGAFGKGAIRCYNCQGEGHMAKDCPSPPKQKGKGKGGKGKGGEQHGAKGAAGKGSKGKGAGPKTGCFTCGGPHYQSDCPKNAKGGKGGKGGLRSMETAWSEDHVQQLCTITTKNRYDPIQEAEDEEVPEDLTLVDSDDEDFPENLDLVETEDSEDDGGMDVPIPMGMIPNGGAQMEQLSPDWRYDAPAKKLGVMMRQLTN